MTAPPELPLEVVGRVRSPEATIRWGRYLRIVDDYPGGIYVLWSDGPEFGGDILDNWFESWDEVRSFIALVGEIEWAD